MLVFSAGLRQTESHKTAWDAANKDLKLPYNTALHAGKQKQGL